MSLVYPYLAYKSLNWLSWLRAISIRLKPVGLYTGAQRNNQSYLEQIPIPEDIIWSFSFAWKLISTEYQSSFKANRRFSCLISRVRVLVRFYVKMSGCLVNKALRDYIVWVHDKICIGIDQFCMIYQLIFPWAKWSPFRRRHFQAHFLEWKGSIFD